MASNARKENQPQAPSATVAAPAPPVPAQPRKPSRWRTWLFRLLTVTLVPAFFLLVVELLLHLCGYGVSSHLFRSDSGGRQAFVENPYYGRLFFPPGLSRGLEPMSFPAVKKEGTYRIFILGESAALGYPDASFNFGRILKAMLQERYPATRFEVINTAMVAINSHVILPIARECADHQPDLFVVYMGNNEVVGPYGASGVLGPFVPNLDLIRASIAFKLTRTGQLFDNVSRYLGKAGPKHYGWGGMGMFVDSQVPADDPQMPGVHAHFASNLQDICAVGRRAGARVVVCTVATNLKDSAPFASAAAQGSTAEQTAAWQKAYDEGIGRESAGATDEALACYRRAAAMDDKVADLHFRTARCLAALKKHGEAHEQYVLARDLDTLRFRADSTINDSIRRIARGAEDDGVYFADVERSFEASSSDGIPGEELLYEHVHLTFEGNYLLARTVLEQVVRVLPDSVRGQGEPTAPFPSLADCRERLPFTPWNRIKGLESVAGLARLPPFPNQLDHAARMERWRRRIEELRQQLDAGGLQEATAAYRRARARNPEDFFLLKDFALLLWEQGQLEETAGLLKEALKLVPHDHIQMSRLAQILGMQGKRDQAQACAAEAVRLMPGDLQLHNVMGRLLVTAGKYDEAAASFEQALKLNPTYPESHLNLGDALAGQKQYDRAAAEYREAIRLDPNYVSAHVRLGWLTFNMRRMDEAQQHFQAALAINPKQPQVQADFATVLDNSGNLDAAIEHMEEALRLRPNWPEKTQALQELRQRKKLGQQHK